MDEVEAPFLWLTEEAEMARLIGVSLPLRGPTGTTDGEAGREDGREAVGVCKVNVTNVSTSREDTIFSNARCECVTKCPTPEASTCSVGVPKSFFSLKVDAVGN